MALLAVVADKAVVETTPHLAHLSVSPVCGSLICLRDTKTTEERTTLKGVVIFGPNKLTPARPRFEFNCGENLGSVPETSHFIHSCQHVTITQVPQFLWSVPLNLHTRKNRNTVFVQE